MPLKRIMMLVLLLIASNSYAKNLFHYQTGDIIFQTSSSNTAKAIELATHSQFSHVGVMLHYPDGWYVFEASQPVKLTLFTDFIKHGKNGHYEILRLKKTSGQLSRAQKQALRTTASTWIGKDYDNAFSWNDEELYCSELVYKLYDRVLHLQLAELKPLKSFDLTSPLVLEQLKVKYGTAIPYDDNMISPEQIYQSTLLKKVKQGGV